MGLGLMDLGLMDLDRDGGCRHVEQLPPRARQGGCAGSAQDIAGTDQVQQLVPLVPLRPAVATPEVSRGGIATL